MEKKTRKMTTMPLALDQERSSVPPISSDARSSGAWGSVEPITERATEPKIAVHEPGRAITRILSVVAGMNAGQVFRLVERGQLIGRSASVDIPIDDGGVSRVHVRLEPQGDGLLVEDAGSTNGTFVNGERTPRKLALPGDSIQLGPNVVLRYAIVDDREVDLLQRLYESSTQDPLTRLYNRRYLMERLVAEVAHARRHKVKLSVLVLDVDHFKRFNDTYGHAIGDVVLKSVASAVTKLVRVEDLVARYGGEEFVVVARSTGRTDGTRLAERIRTHVENLALPLEGDPKVTVSIGVAPLNDLSEEQGAADLIDLADERLYRAKDTGRNRTVSS